MSSEEDLRDRWVDRYVETRNLIHVWEQADPYLTFFLPIVKPVVFALIFASI
jgi:hypothetical protein